MDTLFRAYDTILTVIQNFSQAYPKAYPAFKFVLLLLLFVCCAVLLQKIIVRRFIKWSEKANSPFSLFIADLFKQIGPLFYFALSLYIAAQLTRLSGALMRGISTGFLFVVVYECVRIFERVAFFVIVRYFAKKEEQNENRDESDKPVVEGWITLLLKTILWSLAVLFILNNLGVQITAIAASLGVTSIAVAFALQSILSDIFSSVSIYLDKPFKENDFISVGTDMGTVQKIGIKTTRLTTLQGETLVIPNHELTNIRIRNFKQMEKRRIVFQIGVVYSTPVEQLREIPSFIKEIIEAQEMADFDRAHFSKLASHDLQFEVVYYVNSGEYATYMDVQQSINLGIIEKFRHEKIEFAFPTQTLFIEK